MAFNFDFIKKHPTGTIITVVVGGITLFLLLGGGKSSGAATTSTGTDPVALATMQQNAQAQAQQNAQAGQYALADLQAITTQNLATIKANQDIILGTQANQNQALSINANQDIQNKALAVQSHQIDVQSSTQQHAIDAQTQVQMLGISANEQMQQNQLQAAVDQTKTTAALQQNLAQINANLQQNIVNINDQAQVATTQINSNTQIAINQQNNATAQNGSDNSSWVSTVGEVAGIAAMFFCDVQLKFQHDCVSGDVCLDAIKELPLVRFSYLMGTKPYEHGDVTEHVNTYSQDFYRVLGASDYDERRTIDVIDMMGALCGAVQALAKKDTLYVH